MEQVRAENMFREIESLKVRVNNLEALLVCERKIREKGEEKLDEAVKKIRDLERIILEDEKRLKRLEKKDGDEEEKKADKERFEKVYEKEKSEEEMKIIAGVIKRDEKVRIRDSKQFDGKSDKNMAEEKKWKVVVKRGKRNRGEDIEEWIKKWIGKNEFKVAITSNSDVKIVSFESEEDREDLFRKEKDFMKEEIFYIDVWLTFEERVHRNRMLGMARKLRNKGLEVSVGNWSMWVEGVEIKYDEELDHFDFVEKDDE